MRISYSALAAYKSCPLKFKYQEIDKIKTPKSKEAVFGAAVHESLRFMFKRNPLYPTIHEILDFFYNIWAERSVKINLSEEETNFYKEDGLEILKNFYGKNQPWNFNAVDLESRFNFFIDDEKSKERHTLAGIIDRIDKTSENEYEIIDYKTARRMPSKAKIDEDLQLSIYQLGILDRWPHLDPSKIKLSLYFLKHNEKISTSRNSANIAETKNTLISLINEILEKQKENNFPPTPSALCGWCGYKELCPMWKHEYNKIKSQKSKIQNQNEAENIIKEYVKLKDTEQKNKKKIAELQKLIHNFMDNENVERVFGEKEYITRHIKESVNYDTEKIKDILEPLGIFEKALKIDETALKKIIQKLPEESKEKFKEIIKTTKITKTLIVSKIKQ